MRTTRMTTDEVVNIPSGTTQTIDWAICKNQQLNLGIAPSSVTLTFNNTLYGDSLLLKIVQSGTPQDLIWPSAVKWDDIGEPIWISGVNKTRLIDMYFDGINYFSAASETYS